MIQLSENFMGEEKYANFLGSLSGIESTTFRTKSSKNTMTKHFNKNAKIGKDILKNFTPIIGII